VHKINVQMWHWVKKKGKENKTLELFKNHYYPRVQHFHLLSIINGEKSIICRFKCREELILYNIFTNSQYLMHWLLLVHWNIINSRFGALRICIFVWKILV